MLSLSLLGSFAISLDKRPLTQLSSQKAQALFIYLAVEKERVHQRDSLMALFWPDYPQKSAQQSLRQTIYRLRHAIEPKEIETPFILTDRFTVALNSDAKLDVDVVRFEDLAGNGHSPQAWQQAIDLYRKDFLADFFLPDCEPFEQWVADKRAYYQRKVHELCQRLVNHYLEVGDHTAAETAVRRQLALDNLQEAAHRQLMGLLAKNGRRQEAIAHYNTLEQLLHDELAIEPEAATLSLLKSIREGRINEQSDSRPTLAQSPNDNQADRHNLPHLLTSFIGRDKELDEITQLITDNRLLLLSGVGGIGKTTLSIQVAHQLLDAFPDGIWLVELAPITEKERFEQAIMRALGVWEVANQSFLETTLNYLQSKNVLLILDNCEHVIEMTAHFVQVALQRCPHLKIMANSREILDIAGETIYSVPPLSLPTGQQLTDSTKWPSYGALQLFVERATAVNPQFQVTEENNQSILQICRALDGIPLAIELAAARVKLLSTEQIANRLDDRFHFLTSGRRTVMPRQRTLQALIDWSWGLLSQTEQMLFRRIAVFSGGMILSAIESVCTGNGVEKYDVLDLLTQLVNKSLLRAKRPQGEETRYHMLETIRHYCLMQLADADEEDHYRQRHLEYHLQMAEEAAIALTGPNQVMWMQRLYVELDNFRTALKWAHKHDVEAGLRIATGLWKFWEARGYSREGEAWLGQLLQSTQDIDEVVKAKALGVQSDLSRTLDYPARSRWLAEESLAIFQKLNNPEDIAFGLNRLVTVFDTESDLDSRRQLALQSLSIYTTNGNQLGMAESYNILAGLASDNSDFATELEYMEKSLSIYEQTGHLAGVGGVYFWHGFRLIRQGELLEAKAWLEKDLVIKEQLGLRGSVWSVMAVATISLYLGDYDLAQDNLHKCISLSEHTGETRAKLWAILRLGYLYLKTGQPDLAINLFIEGQQGFLQVGGESIGVVCALEGIASFAVSREEPETAVSLYAWADATRQSLQDIRPPIEQKDVDKDIAIILDMIDEERYTVAYEHGTAMTMDEAITLVAKVKDSK